MLICDVVMAINVPPFSADMPNDVLVGLFTGVEEELQRTRSCDDEHGDELRAGWFGLRLHVNVHFPTTAVDYLV